MLPAVYSGECKVIYNLVLMILGQQNRPAPTAVRKTIDSRQNRATTPTMARRRPGSAASGTASSIVSPCSVTSGISEHKSKASSSRDDVIEISHNKTNAKVLEDAPTMQRSGTFLMEKPTVLNVEHLADTTVH